MTNALLAGTLALAVVTTPAAHGKHMPNTNWGLDPAASNFGGGPVMKSDVISIHEDSEKYLRFDEEAVDGSGASQHLSWQGPEDGTPHPLLGMQGATFAIKNGESGLLTLPDGTREDETFTYAGDKRLTIDIVVHAHDGTTLQQKLVYNRM